MAVPLSCAKENRPIVVADDEPYILRALSYLLEHEGYQVETASNGEEAFSLLRAIHPTLVFLDVMMPRMSGYDVCKKIKEDPTLSDIYVIMLSARGQQSDREQGLFNGANEYITKPFSPRMIAQRVRTLLESSNA